jgi:hypothetical protein
MRGKKGLLQPSAGRHAADELPDCHALTTESRSCSWTKLEFPITRPTLFFTFIGHGIDGGLYERAGESGRSSRREAKISQHLEHDVLDDAI